MKVARYPAYKPSGIDWLGDVPKHWSVKRGRFCMQVNPPSDRLRQLTQHDEVSFVPMDAVGEYGGLNLDTAKPLSEIGSSYTEFQDGDVVVAKITPCFENGKGALVSGLTNGAALGTTELHVLRTRSGFERRFLFYLTISSAYRKLGEAEMYGAGGQKRVPPEFNKDFRTPLPPFDEQRAIADFLDRETAKLDTLVEKKRALIEKLKEKRAALISRTVTRGLPPNAARAAGLNPHPKFKPSGVEWLGDVPEHWIVCKLSYVTISRCDGPFGSGLKSEHYCDEGVRVIRLQNIRFASFDDTDKSFIDPDHYHELGDHDVHAGDVLIAGLGDDKHPVGRACVAPATLGPAMVKADCFRFRLDARKADAAFAALQLSIVASNLSGALATGTTRGRMNLSATAERAISLPTLNEQRAIANHLDHETTKIDRLIEKVEAAIERLREYRTALITAAVTGKIDVRDHAQQRQAA